MSIFRVAATPVNNAHPSARRVRLPVDPEAQISVGLYALHRPSLDQQVARFAPQAPSEAHFADTLAAAEAPTAEDNPPSTPASEPGLTPDDEDAHLLALIAML